MGWTELMNPSMPTAVHCADLSFATGSPAFVYVKVVNECKSIINLDLLCSGQ
jgi:hypothetical protein